MGRTRTSIILVVVLVVVSLAGLVAGVVGSVAATPQTGAAGVQDDTTRNRTNTTVTVRTLRIDRISVSDDTGGASANRSAGATVLRNVTLRAVSVANASATVSGNRTLRGLLAGDFQRGVEIGAEALQGQEKGIDRPSAEATKNLTGENASQRRPIEDLVIGRLSIDHLVVRDAQRRGAATAGNATGKANRVTDERDGSVGATRYVRRASVGRLTIDSLVTRGDLTVGRAGNVTTVDPEAGFVLDPSGPRNATEPDERFEPDDSLGNDEPPRDAPPGVWGVENVSVERASIGTLRTGGITAGVGNWSSGAVVAPEEGNASTVTLFEELFGSEIDALGDTGSTVQGVNTTDPEPPAATGPEGPAENETGLS